MKKSSFIIKQNGSEPNSVLLYSTFTTSMVEMDKDKFINIFENHAYEKNKDEVLELYDMGFLIDDDYDEKAFMESLRVKTLSSNKSKPTYYIICPTTGCNARCYYCFEKGAVQKKMDRRTANAVAEYIAKNHDDNLVIQWFGGEPLLEPETISYISDFLHKNGVSFDSKIISNGYLMTDKIVDLALNKWNVKVIQITIDAIEDEYNKIKDYVYSEENPFKIVMKNIERCLNNDLNVRIRINFNPLEYQKAIETVEYLKKRFEKYNNFFVYLASIDSIEVPSITEEFRNKTKHPLIELLDAEEDFCSFGNYDSSDENFSEYDAILRKYYLTPIPISCYGGCESSLTIDSSGNIFDCHRLLGHQEYASGNVFDGRVMNETSKYYANPNLDNLECEECNLLPICQGGCKFRAFKYGRDHACTIVKGAVKELIKRAYNEISNL